MRQTYTYLNFDLIHQGNIHDTSTEEPDCGLVDHRIFINSLISEFVCGSVYVLSISLHILGNQMEKSKTLPAEAANDISEKVNQESSSFLLNGILDKFILNIRLWLDVAFYLTKIIVENVTILLNTMPISYDL